MMNKQNRLQGWSMAELLWLVTATAVILLLSLYWQESWIGITTALSGVICVILTGKGKPIAYAFGLVNVIFYAYVAWGAKYYGEVMLNLLCYLPMNFVGWYLWRKNIDEATGEVTKKRLPLKMTATILAFITASVFIYGVILRTLGGNLPFVDSASTILSIAAQILCVQRFAQQWLLWIIIDAISIFMWLAAFQNGGESIATLLMWGVYLLNAIFMYIKWTKEAKQCAMQ